MSKQSMQLTNFLVCATTVLTVLVQVTHGQAYLFTWENFVNPPATLNTNISEPENTAPVLVKEPEENNTKIIVYKNTVVEKSNELSQTAMDIITIVWYVATFLALAAFFMLMACSDRRCRDAQGQRNGNANDTPLPPPTPSPSYSEFAPPSYETVIKMQNAPKTSIFVIPFPNLETAIPCPVSKDDNNQTGQTQTQSQPQPQSTLNVYTINELQKLGS